MIGLAEDLSGAYRPGPLSGRQPQWRPRAPLELLVLVDEADPATGLACVHMNEVRGPHPVLKAAATHAQSEGRTVHVRAACAEDASLLMRQALPRSLS